MQILERRIRPRGGRFEQVTFANVSPDEARRIFKQTSYHPERIIICAQNGTTATRRPYVFARYSLSTDQALTDIQNAEAVTVKTSPR